LKISRPPQTRLSIAKCLPISTRVILFPEGAIYLSFAQRSKITTDCWLTQFRC
jgi:ABC-type phosphate transport system ATPase subunit